MRTVVTILGAALVACLFLGYAAYRDISSRLDSERHLRENYEMATNIILHKYLEVLDAIESRQTGVENVVTRGKELDLTFKNIRGYNARTRLEKPRKRQLAIGGSQ